MDTSGCGNLTTVARLLQAVQPRQQLWSSDIAKRQGLSCSDSIADVSSLLLVTTIEYHSLFNCLTALAATCSKQQQSSSSVVLFAMIA
jgi:hypothetical protein